MRLMTSMVSQVLYSSKKDNWETPQELFDALNKEFSFHLDIAADDQNHKCMFYFTKENSAFDNCWFGNVWCNPPYGRDIGKWVRACAEYRGLSVMLLPARTDTRWFHEYIYKNPRVVIRFLKGRLKFGDSQNSAPFPSMIVIFNKV